MASEQKPGQQQAGSVNETTAQQAGQRISTTRKGGTPPMPQQQGSTLFTDWASI